MKRPIKNIRRSFKRLELRQANDIRDAVRDYLRHLTVDEVAAITTMPKTLIRRLQSDNDQRLHDCIKWMRRSGYPEHQEQMK
jgi:hypothetical protein